MRYFLAIVIGMTVGCTQPTVTPVMRSLMVACMADAAVSVNRVDHAVPADNAPPSPPTGCCRECNGTGKVLSGDKIEKVDCECQDSCECKQRRDVSSASPCPRCLNSGKVLSQDGKKIVRCELCGVCSDGYCRPTR